MVFSKRCAKVRIIGRITKLSLSSVKVIFHYLFQLGYQQFGLFRNLTISSNPGWMLIRDHVI